MDEEDSQKTCDVCDGKIPFEEESDLQICDSCWAFLDLVFFKEITTWYELELLLKHIIEVKKLLNITIEQRHFIGTYGEISYTSPKNILCPICCENKIDTTLTMHDVCYNDKIRPLIENFDRNDLQQIVNRKEEVLKIWASPDEICVKCKTNLPIDHIEYTEYKNQCGRTYRFCSRDCLKKHLEE